MYACPLGLSQVRDYLEGTAELVVRRREEDSDSSEDRPAPAHDKTIAESCEY